MKNLVKNTILFVCFVIFPAALALCQPASNPINWQFSIKWEDVPLSEIPLLDTKIQILDGRANVLFLFYKSELSEEILLKAEGDVNNGKILLNEWDKEINQLSGSFTVKDKKLNIGPLTGKLGTAPFDAQAEMDLIPPYPFQVNVKAKGVLFEEISSFFPFLK